MGVKMHSLSFAGATFALNNLDADRGTEVLAQLAAVIGDPLGDVVAEAMKHGTMKEVPKDIVAKAVGMLLARLHTGGAKQIIRVLLDGLMRDQKPVDFAQYFAGNYKELFRLVAWALEINFRDFFNGEGLAAVIGNSTLTSLFRQPPSQTGGPSGGS